LKALILALVLTVIGIAFLVAAIVVLVRDGEAGIIIAFFVLSGVCLIPGGYHAYLFFHSLRHDPGFSVGDIPSFDE
jgi:hypothetical protein